MFFAPLTKDSPLLLLQLIELDFHLLLPKSSDLSRRRGAGGDDGVDGRAESGSVQGGGRVGGKATPRD